MRGMKIVGQTLILYIFYKLGLFIKEGLDLPIPGSIIGLILLLSLLLTGVMKEKALEDGAGFLLLYLPLFFVPATVGVMDYFGFLTSSAGMMMLGALFIGTLLVMLSSALVSQKAVEMVDKNTKGAGGNPS
ncbi:Holin-like protein CidA [Bacillus sp. THAF10]|uniref:CidA/LrgA family protein n=1 Tax=Bacillus sp. THAF10 TaxID=2587848 RepID=UPI00126881BE|nr:CidA/LrgA family protein [Bacillus sp. THAF10]QFT90251.1 Holin-like protein CidA [Bacillus sp. THAF10]